jgi:hypothetical protein
MSTPSPLNPADSDSPEWHYERLILSQSMRGEECLAFQHGETRPPFIIRIMPFVPDLLTRSRKFLLGITDRRVLILELTNPFNKLKLPDFKALIASLPFSQIESVEPRRGTFTSDLTIVAKSGHRYIFTNMLLSAPDTFASNLQAVIARAGANPAAEFSEIPVVLVPPVKLANKVGGCLSALFGLFMLLGSLGGFIEKDYNVALVMLLVSSPFLWFGFIRNLIKKA